ncbi:hypothetical protein NDU88_006416 [Pleurodeles waltl]|uniref:Uncharacterized protein n=1 Tax=Pleurodeles waltl TaxID=8319 RepID=A0AAV7TER7_PLEWA|nr:hypothetical protein NDU88_006416 [Pleurodeles waltl]
MLTLAPMCNDNTGVLDKLHHRTFVPSKKEVQQERQKVVEAVASLTGQDLSPIPATGEEMDQSGLDQDSDITRISEEEGLEVTPGTSHCII